VSNWFGWLEWIVVIVVITRLMRGRRATKAQHPAPAPTPMSGRREAGPRSDPGAGLALGHGLDQHDHLGGSAATAAFWAGAVSRSEMDDDVDADVDADLD
jgi:hypothetical protein